VERFSKEGGDKNKKGKRKVGWKIVYLTGYQEDTPRKVGNLHLEGGEKKIVDRKFSLREEKKESVSGKQFGEGILPFEKRGHGQI